MAPRTTDKFAALNRRARHEYFIEDSIEAGIVLMGSEVKSIRLGHVSIAESHAGQMLGEVWLFNAHIPLYKPARDNHEERRPRKLLLQKKQRNKLLASIKREGITLVPLSLYFNDRGLVKVELGVARGKKKHDKRETEKQRDWNRDKARLLRRD